MVADAETHADEDRRARELAEARNNGENAAYQAERQLKELGDAVDDALAHEIEAAIKAIREVLEGDDPAAIRDAHRRAELGLPPRLRGDVRARAAAQSGNGSAADVAATTPPPARRTSSTPRSSTSRARKP